MAAAIELNFPNPIEMGADLFDREDELRRIRETLQSPTRRPIVIKGERVMGKTSLLNIVREWATEQGRFAVLRLPHVLSRDEFAEEILDGIAGEAGASLHQLGLRNQDGRFRLKTMIELTTAAEDLLAAAERRTFLLLLDEFDSMLMKCRDEAARNQILDLILHLVDKTSLPVKFVCTMTRTAPQLLHSDASQFMSAARIVALKPWTSEESRAFVDWLLEGTINLDERAHEQLYAAGGGHPYLTKAVLQLLQERHRGATVAAEQVQAVAAATIALPELDFTLDNLVQMHFTHEQSRVLMLAARTGGITEAGLRTGEGSRVGAAHELQRRGYLRADGAGGYTPAFGLLTRWLNAKPLADASLPPEAPTAADDDPAVAADVELLVIDDLRKRAFLGGGELRLTAQEYRFLSYLAEHAGSVVDRRTIASKVWPGEALLDGVREGRLDALVYRLREGLGHDGTRYVETRRGRGFYLNPELVRRIPRE